jgi:RNA polymerase sporulation-specific sigma factor
MFAKYKHLISKKIGMFHLGYDYDDMMQEGYMVLYRSITSFDMAEQKTFTRYFELNLKRRFITIVTKRVRRSEIFHKHHGYIYEHNHVTKNTSAYFELYLEEIAKILTEKEYLVYTLRELQNFSIDYIEHKSELSSKVIYNSLHRAKAKIKKHFHTDLDKDPQI